MNREKVKAMVATLSDGNTTRKPGSGFVAEEPLKKESKIAFVGKISVPEDVEVEIESPASKFSHIQSPPKAYSYVKSEDRLPDKLMIERSISKLGNYIKEWIINEHLYDSVSDTLKPKNLVRELFYRRTQSSVYHSLLEFCGVTRNLDGSITFPEVTRDMECISTLYFLDRMFTDQSLIHENYRVVMDKYRRIYSDHNGIQVEWLEVLKKKLSEKAFIDSFGINAVLGTIKANWCTPVEKSIIITEPPEPTKIPQTYVIQNPVTDDDDEEYEDEDDDDDMREPLTVTIEHDNAFDIIIISHSIVRYPSPSNLNPDVKPIVDEIAIPFVVNLDDVPINGYIPSLSDDRNGMWDWLIHFQPDMVFPTKSPERYLEWNSNSEVTYVKCVILDYTKEDEEYIMGVYRVDEEFGNSKENEEIIKQINHVVKDDIASGTISSLKRTLVVEELFETEENVLAYITQYESEDDDEDDDDELTQAAIETILTNSTEEVYEEEEEEASEERDTSEEGISDEEDDDFIFNVQTRDRKTKK